MFRRRARELDETQLQLLEYFDRCLPIAKKHVVDFAKMGAEEAEALRPENIVTFNQYRSNSDNRNDK